METCGMRTQLLSVLVLAFSVILSTGCARTTAPVSSATVEATLGVLPESDAAIDSSIEVTSETKTDVLGTAEAVMADVVETDVTAPKDVNALPETGTVAGVEVEQGVIKASTEGVTEQQPPEPELSEVQKLTTAGDHAGALKLALASYREGKTENSSEIWEAVEANPMLMHTLYDEVKPHGTNTISALGGGSSVSFKYVDSEDEAAKAALKPDQDLRQTMYRSGIAFYRLCQIVECSFDTPVTRPVKFSKSDFNALYNASTSSKNKGYRSKFEHLLWATEGSTKYLYAGYKEWISPFTSFPIEATSAWSPYLKNPDANVPDLKTLLRNILQGGRPGAVKELNKLVEYAGDMTSRDLLQQISDIILIDYLANNWDRFSGAADNYGANCHFQPGGIIAIDNDAAFPAWHAPRVVRRLNLVEMFSKKLVQNLRMLDEKELFEHMFPEPTKEERQSFERFKERRRDALKYIDKLIEKKGEDKVLVF